MSDGARSSGGPQGVTAKYDDMRSTGQLLMGMSTMFGTDAATVGWYATDPDLLSSAVFAPVQAVQVETSLAGIGINLGTDAVELGVLGTFLVGAVEAYEIADQAIADLETGVSYAIGFAVGYALPGIALVAAAKYVELAGTTWAVDQARGLIDPSYDPRDFGQIFSDQNKGMLALADDTGLTDWLMQHPEIADPIMRSLPGLVAGLTTSLNANPITARLIDAVDIWTGGKFRQGVPLTYEQTVAAILGYGAAFSQFNDGKAIVRPFTDEEKKLTDEAKKLYPTIRSVNDLKSVFASLGELDRFDHYDPKNDADPNIPPEYSRIRIIQSVGDDGVTRWIVQIPSTQSWETSAGPALNDVTACLVEMSDQQSALSAAVQEAMRQAGVAPGDPVMLTGFSLGGITAGHLAADPSFTSTYNVQAVVTAGSPVANFNSGNDIQVLSFEHPDDPVPHLDSGANPDRPNWTTITDTTPTVANPYENPEKSGDESASGAHNAFTYAQTAADAQSSRNPGVDQFMNTVAPFLNGDQTATDFRAERVH